MRRLWVLALSAALVLGGTVLVVPKAVTAASLDPAAATPTIAYLNTTYCEVSYASFCEMNISTDAGSTLVVLGGLHSDTWESLRYGQPINTSVPHLNLTVRAVGETLVCEHPFLGCVKTVDDGEVASAAEDTPAEAKVPLFFNATGGSYDLYMVALDVIGVSKASVTFANGTNGTLPNFDYRVPMNVSCDAATPYELALGGFTVGDFHEEPGPYVEPNATHPPTNLTYRLGDDGESANVVGSLALPLGFHLMRWDEVPSEAFFTAPVPWAGACVVLAPTASPVNPPPYDVSFEEAGLPFGTTYGLSWDAVLHTAVAPAWVNFTSDNGTFGWTVDPVSTYSVVPSSGHTVVSGGPVLLGVAYVPRSTTTYDNKTVTVTIWDNTTVTNWDNTTVVHYDNSTEIFYNITTHYDDKTYWDNVTHWVNTTHYDNTTVSLLAFDRTTYIALAVSLFVGALLALFAYEGGRRGARAAFRAKARADAQRRGRENVDEDGQYRRP